MAVIPNSISTQMSSPMLEENDAAMSLCLLGSLQQRNVLACPPQPCIPQTANAELTAVPMNYQFNPNQMSPPTSTIHVHTPTTGSTLRSIAAAVDVACSSLPNSTASLCTAVGQTETVLNLDNRLRIGDGSTLNNGGKTKSAKVKNGAVRVQKERDPKRDTSVPFEEMKRLMRVYGSIKCLRNRTPKESGKITKTDSIKRKFYRWFPDFEERFEKTSEGWYRPKAGHEEEMRYRDEMRAKDQICLVKKRNCKRYRTSSAKALLDLMH